MREAIEIDREHRRSPPEQGIIVADVAMDAHEVRGR